MKNSFRRAFAPVFGWFFFFIILCLNTYAHASDPPKIVSVPNNTAAVGEPYSYDDNGLPEATGTLPVTWELATEAKEASIDSETGEINWIPTAWGEVELTIKAVNDFGEDEQSFNVLVLMAPEIISTPETTAGAYHPYHYDSDDTLDAQGSEPIIWSLIKGPDDFIVEAATGHISWIPVESGSYSITVMAENLAGIDEQSFTVVVSGESRAPVIDETANLSAMLGQIYIYDEDRKASASGIPPIAWSKTQGPDEFRIDENTGLITWMPTTAGDIPITISTTNSEGTDDYSFTVTVISEPTEKPIAVINAEPASGQAPLTVRFDASQSTTASGAEIIEYRWDFGDSTPPKIGQQVEHIYIVAGSFVARLTITDNWGQTADAFAEISIAAKSGEMPPRARIGYDKIEGEAPLNVHFTCEGEDAGKEGYNVLWDYGDGDRSYEWNPSHTFNNPGSYHTRLTVLAPSGLEATESVVVMVTKGQKLPPLAEAYADPSFGDAPLTVRFISSAGDFDGVITFKEWDFGEGDITQNLNPIRTFSKQGIYSISFTAVDNDGLSSTAWLEIRIMQDGKLPPLIISIPNLKTFADRPYSYDEDSLPTARGNHPLTWKLGKELAGELINIPNGMTIDENTGEIEWTPGNDQAGENKVTLRAENSAGIDFQDFVIVVQGEEDDDDDNTGASDDDAGWVLDGGSTTDRADEENGGCSCRVR